MKRISFDKSMASEVEINMSPMIDCVFLLLIFFIVTTVFVKDSGVEINKPSAISSQVLKKQSVILALTSDNQIVYNGEALGLNSVRGLVARQIGGRDIPVIIMADKASNTGRLIELMDECKRGGAKHVSVATKRKVAR